VNGTFTNDPFTIYITLAQPALFLPHCDETTSSIVRTTNARY